MMTVRELKKSFQPASVEEIMKTVFSIDITSTTTTTTTTITDPFNS